MTKFSLFQALGLLGKSENAGRASIKCYHIPAKEIVSSILRKKDYLYNTKIRGLKGRR